ncbi:MAG TPA: alpha-L-fucosidase, partial [Flavisolibacter sp.]
KVASAGSIISTLVDIVSKNGTLLLNLSPKADGTIPAEQKKTLLEVGKWLSINGEAIYDTHNWIKFGEESTSPKLRFTVKGDALFAIIVGNWPGTSILIPSLGMQKTTGEKIVSVTMLGNKGQLHFTQEQNGLTVDLPATPPCENAYTLKITGLKMNAPAWTPSGNPIVTETK